MRKSFGMKNKAAEAAVETRGRQGDGWKTVRHSIGLAGCIAGLLCAGASVAVAGTEPDVAPAVVLHMQTAFNPNLPGAGEAVRTFTKSLKHMSGGALGLEIFEPG